MAIINIPPSGDLCRVRTEMALVGTYPADTRFVNLTPHVLNVHTDDDGNIELYAVKYGDISGLPDPQPNVVYVTSGLVNAALPDRPDVVSPGDHVRDEAGKPIGCVGFRK